MHMGRVKEAKYGMLAVPKLLEKSIELCVQGEQIDAVDSDFSILCKINTVYLIFFIKQNVMDECDNNNHTIIIIP